MLSAAASCVCVKGAQTCCIVNEAAQLLWVISPNQKQLQMRFLIHNTT